jgi:3-oxoadipate enol-lactonase
MEIFTLDPNPSARPGILLLHGLGADGSMWTPQLAPLIEAGLRPLAVDLPGFGKSRYDGRGWTLKRVAARLVQFVEEKQVVPVHVVGLSLGGVIAQQFALDHPAHVQTLTLVSTFGALRPENPSQCLYFLQRALVVHLLGLEQQSRLVARRVFPRPEDDELRRLTAEKIMAADPRAYRAAMRALGLFNALPRLNQIAVPTLVVSGTADSTVTPTRQAFLAQAIPGARQVLIERAGHALNIDHSAEFNAILLDFLFAKPTG